MKTKFLKILAVLIFISSFWNLHSNYIYYSSVLAIILLIISLILEEKPTIKFEREILDLENNPKEK